MEETLKAYLAGIVDGEACITCGNHASASPTIIVQIGMCNEEIPKLFYDLFGGTLYPITPKNERHSPSWTWSVSGNGIKPLLQTIQPFVRVKKRSVELALQYASLLRTNRDARSLSDKDILIRYILAAEIVKLTAKRVR